MYISIMVNTNLQIIQINFSKRFGLCEFKPNDILPG